MLVIDDWHYERATVTAGESRWARKAYLWLRGRITRQPYKEKAKEKGYPNPREV